MLMYQLLSGRNAVSDRFYRALYAVLLTEGGTGAAGEPQQHCAGYGADAIRIQQGLKWGRACIYYTGHCAASLRRPVLLFPWLLSGCSLGHAICQVQGHVFQNYACLCRLLAGPYWLMGETAKISGRFGIHTIALSPTLASLLPCIVTAAAAVAAAHCPVFPALSGVRAPQFLSLMVKAMKADASIKRLAAFAKRLLQVGNRPSLAVVAAGARAESLCAAWCLTCRLVLGEACATSRRCIKPPCRSSAKVKTSGHSMLRQVCAVVGAVNLV